MSVALGVDGNEIRCTFKSGSETKEVILNVCMKNILYLRLDDGKKIGKLGDKVLRVFVFRPEENKPYYLGLTASIVRDTDVLRDPNAVVDLRKNSNIDYYLPVLSAEGT